MEPVDCYLIDQLGEPARVVCLPTAAGTEGPEKIASWSEKGIDHFTRLEASVKAIPVIDRISANDPEYAQEIAEANFIYLSGGKPDYLFQTLYGSLAWEAIMTVLCKGGILVGCSAGAMILGTRYYGFPGWRTGFGLVHNAAILPHFDEIPEAMVHPIRLLTSKEFTLLGIEGNTALVQKGDWFEVVGSKGVTVWNSSGKKRYTAGPVPPWYVSLEDSSCLGT